MTFVSVAHQRGLALVDKIRPVSRETQERFSIYHDLLVKWQARFNLISPATVDNIWQRHIVDSVQMHNALGSAGRVVDIGSGAGFPGLVIAILMAEQATGSVYLIESNAKKCAFINAVIRSTDLRSSGIELEVHNGRIEKYLPLVSSPDVITARALAPLNELLGLTEFHLRKGTAGYFAKGRDHEPELVAARRNWEFDCEILNSGLEPGSVILKISALKAR